MPSAQTLSRFDSEHKKFARMAVADFFTPAVQRQVSLWFPGEEMADVKELLSRAPLADGKLILVERKADVADTIRRACRRSDDERLRAAQVFEGRLCDLPLDTLLRSDECINAAWLDVGTLYPEDLHWCREELAPNLCSGSTLAVTLQKNRAFPVFQRARKLFDAAGQHYLRWAREAIHKARLVVNTVPVKGRVTPPYRDDDTVLTNYLLHGKLVSRRFSAANVYHVAMLRTLFDTHNMDLDLCLSYPGEGMGVKYSVIGLTGFEPRKHSALDDLFNEYWSKIMRGEDIDPPAVHPDYGKHVQSVFLDGVGRGSACHAVKKNMPASAYVTRLAELAGIPSPLSSTAA